MHRMQQVAPEKQFIAADPEAVCAYMKTITLTGVRDSLAARPLPRHRSTRHRGARPRRDRPHGGARAGDAADAERIAAVALAEDGATRRHHRASPCPPALAAEGVIEYRSGGVLAGAAYADAVARACECRIEWRAPDGRARRARARSSGIVHGPLGRILRAERPLLNLLQRACGIATATRRVRRRGRRHRLPHPPHPEDGARASRARRRRGARRRRRRATASTSRHEVMVKDNHWQALRAERQHAGRRAGRGAAAGRHRAAGGGRVAGASWRRPARPARRGSWSTIRRPTTVRAWAGARGSCGRGSRSRRPAESRWRTCARYAEAGADFVSIGALTHSVMAADIGLEIAAAVACH